MYLARLAVVIALLGVPACVRDVWMYPPRDASAEAAIDAPAIDVPPVDVGPTSPPCPIAPLSTATLTSRRPTLRWALTSGDGAHVELCRDRALATGCVPFDAVGTSGAPAAELAAGVWFWRLATRVGSTTTTSVGPVWQFVVGARTATLDLSWGTYPDFNGDGYADFAVGAPGSHTAYVYPGGASGLSATPTTLDGPVDFGAAVASAGDLDGDGYADLVVGATMSNAAYVYRGSATSDGLRGTPVTLAGPAGSVGFGASVASAGDLDGDGYAELIVGAAGSNTAYVYRGGPGTPGTPVTLTGPAGSGNFGSVGSAGDLNGDGYADLVVGDSNYRNRTGWAYVYLGGPGAPAWGATPIILTGADAFGSGVANAGDVNGDGYADLAVTAYAGNQTFVYLGRPGARPTDPSPIVLTGAASANHYGGSMAGAGDVDGDGYADLVVSSPDANLAKVYLGAASAPLSGPSPIVLLGPDGSRYFGTWVTGAGDVNGDGYDDLGVSDFIANRAHLYLGAAGAGALRATPTALNGPVSGSRFGSPIY